MPKKRALGRSRVTLEPRSRWTTGRRHRPWGQLWQGAVLFLVEDQAEAQRLGGEGVRQLGRLAESRRPVSRGGRWESRSQLQGEGAKPQLLGLQVTGPQRQLRACLYPRGGHMLSWI